MATTSTYMDPFGVGGDAYNLASNTAQSNLAAGAYNVQLSNLINAQNQAMQQQANASRLGPEGQQTQQNLLDVAQRQSQGLLDPATEQMLQAGIAANGAATGMGVDSPNLASAYRRALGLDINATEAQGQSNYLGLLAANPSAPLYDMSTGNISPASYASAAQAQAALQENARQADAALAEQAREANLAASTRTATAGAGARVTPTAAQSNTVPYGGGGGYPTSYVPSAPIAYDFGASYSPGGSSVLGTVDTGAGNTADLWDPSGLFSNYGQMPDYSQVGSDPIASALGWGTDYSSVPADTSVDPYSGDYYNNYGYGDYYSY